MRNIILVSLSLALWLVMSGCIEEIRTATDREKPIFVVDGRLVSGEAVIRLSFTSVTDRISIPVSDATVIVRSSTGVGFIIREESEGEYLLSTPDFDVLPGEDYKVEITLPDGRRYESVADTVPSRAGQDAEVGWNLTSQQGLEYIGVWASPTYPESEEPIYSLWEITDAFIQSPVNFPDPFNSIPPPCFVVYQPDLQRIPLLDASRFSGASLEEINVGLLRITSFFDEKHVVSVEHFSISPEAYQYWSRINQLLEQNGSLFDPPVAPVGGNVFQVDSLQNPVRGYVMATTSSIKRFAIYAANLPIDGEDPCEYTPALPTGQYPKGCVNCLEIPGSSYAAPTYYYQVR